MGQDGVVAGGMEAENDFVSGRFFDAQTLGADGHASVAADFDWGAHTPDIRPPGTAGCRAQNGSLFFFGVVPGAERGLAQFAMDFVGVVMVAQRVDVAIGFGQFGNFFTGEIRRQAALPELVFAFDFALGLRSGGVAQADVVELQGRAQLREGIGIVREEKAVVIDVELQRTTVGQKGGGQEIKIGEQEFAFVKFGAGEQTAAIIEHIEHGEEDFGMSKPAVGRGVELPEFADLGALPAADRSENALGREAMGQIIFDGPMTNLGTVEWESVQAQGFGSGEAVRTRRVAVQTFFEKVEHRLRPGFGVIAAGRTGRPEVLLFFGASQKVSGGKKIEATAGKAELIGGFCGAQGVLPEGFEDMTDERRRVTMDELLKFFTLPKIRGPVAPAVSLFVAIAPLGSSKTDGGGKALRFKRSLSCFENYRTCPVLLAPRQHHLNGSALGYKHLWNLKNSSTNIDQQLPQKPHPRFRRKIIPTRRPRHAA